MLPGPFALLTLVLGYAGGLSYLISTLKGENKPNRVTWGLWPVISSIVLLAQLSEGLSWAVTSAALTVTNTSIVFIASFLNKNSYWKSNPRDYIFAATSISGLIMWQLTNQPVVAIAFSIAADFMAFSPTVIKAYNKPETESVRPYMIWSIAHIPTLLVVDQWAFQNYAYSAYQVMINMIVAIGASGYFVFANSTNPTNHPPSNVAAESIALHKNKILILVKVK